MLKSLSGGGGGGGGGIPFVRLNATYPTAFRFLVGPAGYDGNTTDIFVTISDSSFFYVDGLDGGVDGRRVRIWSVNTAIMTVENNSDSADVGNRIVFAHFAFNIPTGSGVELVYDEQAFSGDGGWRMTTGAPPPA